ncbi:MAG TPA: transcriptional regulator NrdR [Thiobacillaceae bacterium]|nr:transcriptional regulator NrdR [Thiobacillaceae bacterium]HNU65083.1 transcriptional regulator NrdR [Thiobacillaceae bacterium]
MKCPFCGASDTQVVETRLSEDGASIRRRRRCTRCDKRFTTYETAEVRAPAVVKSGGERQDFSRGKVQAGFRKALHKRPVSTELMEAAIDRVVHKVLALGEREIDSRLIGEWVMAELKRLDKVAYIRFASVYRAFQDVDDFRHAIREVDSGKLEAGGGE